MQPEFLGISSRSCQLGMHGASAPQTPVLRCQIRSPYPVSVRPLPCKCAVSTRSPHMCRLYEPTALYPLAPTFPVLLIGCCHCPRRSQAGLLALELQPCVSPPPTDALLCLVPIQARAILRSALGEGFARRRCLHRCRCRGCCLAFTALGAVGLRMTVQSEEGRGSVFMTALLLCCWLGPPGGASLAVCISTPAHRCSAGRLQVYNSQICSFSGPDGGLALASGKLLSALTNSVADAHRTPARNQPPSSPRQGRGFAAGPAGASPCSPGPECQSVQWCGSCC